MLVDIDGMMTGQALVIDSGVVASG